MNMRNLIAGIAIVAVIGLVSLSLILVAQNATDEVPEDAQRIEVSLNEYAIEMPQMTESGTIAFEVTNNGMIDHNFVIEGNDVNVRFDSNIPPGETETLIVELQPGLYDVYCPEADHRSLGMQHQLTVEGQETVDVSLTSFDVTVSPAEITTGEIVFNVTNNAEDLEHEFMIIRTATDAAELPTTESGRVDEEQVEIVGEIEAISPDETSQISLNLEPWHYVLICNVPGHYNDGMYVNFTVTEASDDGLEEMGGRDTLETDQSTPVILTPDMSTPDATDAASDNNEMEAEEVEVNMTDFTFQPQRIEVEPGTTVTWVNNDAFAHTVTAGTRDNPTDEFSSGEIEPRDSFSYTFDEPGTYEYFCTIHEGMSGTIVVAETATGMTNTKGNVAAATLSAPESLEGFRDEPGF